MKKFYTLVIAFLALHGAMAQGCLPEGITFTTQEQIDNFQTDYPGCTEIEGSVFIYGYESNITSLNGLSVITSMGSDLNICCSSLVSLSGLDNLTTIDGILYVLENDLLINLSGLESLDSIGGLVDIVENNSLLSLTGFENLVSIGGDLSIRGNSALTSLFNLNVLTFINGGIYIENNDALISLSGLDNIDTESIAYLLIGNNNMLSDCIVQSVCNYLANPNGSINIYNNNDGCNNPIQVANNCGVTLPICLPYGNYYFLSQVDIDNFQTYYPDCNELNGYVVILGSDIFNLYGLNDVTSVGDGLQIRNTDILTNLEGFDNLTSIGGRLYIENNNGLMNIEALKNLTFINYGLVIANNNNLANLKGLDNFITSSNSFVEIYQNYSLSKCDVQSICDYLSNPYLYAEIYDNFEGCNSIEEVEYACLVGLENIIQENNFSIFPNPSSSRFIIQFSLENQEEVKLAVMNNLGQVVEIITNERLQPGNYEYNWNAESMPAGVYFYHIQIGNQAGTGKMVLVR